MLSVFHLEYDNNHLAEVVAASAEEAHTLVRRTYEQFAFAEVVRATQKNIRVAQFTKPQVLAVQRIPSPKQRERLAMLKRTKGPRYYKQGFKRKRR